MKDQLVKILGKYGTLLVDRRFIGYILSLLVMFGILPAVIDTESLSNEFVDAVLLIFQGADTLLGILVLLYSWTKREPSGLNYGIPIDVKELAEALLKVARG